MTIKDISEILCADILTEDVNLDKEVLGACGSDMMSDVLAFVKDQAVLLTGLVNIQVVRTAIMMDMVCIVFVRGKTPGEALIELAKESDIAILTTNLPMFPACGKLYGAGLRGGQAVNE